MPRPPAKPRPRAAARPGKKRRRKAGGLRGALRKLTKDIKVPAGHSWFWLVVPAVILSVLMIAGKSWLEQKNKAMADTPPEARATIDDRVKQYGPAADARWAPDFAKAKIAYPPAAITLIGLKKEKVLQVYAAGPNLKYKFIRAYPIKAASGSAGPKLREGDGQVPEGLYTIDSLNPNSRFHLSLHVSYPNDFDVAKGRADARDKLGGAIMIHGSDVSIGCLAMGDEAAEDLFILAARTKDPLNLRVILAPQDFRVTRTPASDAPLPPWIGELYPKISAALAGYALPPGEAARRLPEVMKREGANGKTLPKIQLPLCRSEYLQDLTIELGRRMRPVRRHHHRYSLLFRVGGISTEQSEYLFIWCIEFGRVTDIVIYEDATAWIEHGSKVKGGVRIHSKLHLDLSRMDAPALAELLVKTMLDQNGERDFWESLPRID